MQVSLQTQPNEIDWEMCYQQLSPRVRSLVYQMKIPRWQGEEEEVAGDVVQDSMRKLFEYTRRVSAGQKKPVQELERLLYIIALNCLRDRRRREIRLTEETEYHLAQSADTRSHPSEAAVENVYQERLFYLLARKIALFPRKQRGALLTDLANHMAFEEKPTTLQAAFRAVNISLEEFRHRLPDARNKQECSRYAALLYQANRRLRTLKDQEIQEYLAEIDADKQPECSKAICTSIDTHLADKEMPDLEPDLADDEEQILLPHTSFQDAEIELAESHSRQLETWEQKEADFYADLLSQAEQILEELHTLEFQIEQEAERELCLA